MKPFLKFLLAAFTAIFLVYWAAHRNDTDHAAEACRIGDDWE